MIVFDLMRGLCYETKSCVHTRTPPLIGFIFGNMTVCQLWSLTHFGANFWWSAQTELAPKLAPVFISHTHLFLLLYNFGAKICYSLMIQIKVTSYIRNYSVLREDIVFRSCFTKERARQKHLFVCVRVCAFITLYFFH